MSEGREDSSVRKKDTNETVRRSRRRDCRTHQHVGQWYFRTREGDRGPFETREAAVLELMRYVDTMEFVEENESSVPSDIEWADMVFVDLERREA